MIRQCSHFDTVHRQALWESKVPNLKLPNCNNKLTSIQSNAKIENKEVEVALIISKRSDAAGAKEDS